MAEEENNEEPQSAADALVDDEEKSESKGGKIPQILLFVAVAVLSVAGGHFARRMMGSTPSPPGEAAPDGSFRPIEGGDLAYYALEPIIVNLNEPRLTRYIRATLMLAIRTDDFDNASEAIEKRLPEVKSWLILYLADCSLADVRGGKNLNRILRDIQDTLNERLWPQGRPLIVKVDYKDWAVQ